MIKKIKVIIIYVIVFFLTGFAFPDQNAKENKISVDKIIKKYLDAIGGKEKIKKIKSKTTLYNVFMQTRKGYLVERTIQRKGTLKSQRVGGNRYLFYDGNKLWNISGGEKKELTGKVVAQFRKKADLDGPFIDHKKKGVTIRYAGMEKVEFSQFIKLEVSWKDNVKKLFYFDQVSGLLKMSREPSYRLHNGKVTSGPDSITYFYDYREIKGVKYPFSWVQTDDKLGHMHLFTVENIKIL